MELFRYQQADGRVPFDEWLGGLRNKVAQARVRGRLSQLEAGNFGEWASVGAGVLELKVNLGAGYRVYCGRRDDIVVVLLCGGDKGSQAADIKLAKRYWLDWKRRQA